MRLRLFGKDPVEQLLADEERRLAVGRAIGGLKIAKTLLPDQPKEPIEAVKELPPPPMAERQPEKSADTVSEANGVAPNAPTQAIIINSNPVPLQENATTAQDK